MEASETVDLVWQALETLPDRQREIFILTEIEGKTFQEIANETGVSINTLLSQKRYAINKLKAMLSLSRNGED